MKTFRMHIMSSSQTETVDDTESFVASTEDGQFGILAHAGRRMEILKYGLARFRRQTGDTEYLALAGGILYFLDNVLFLATSSYIRHRDYNVIGSLLDERIRIDEQQIQDMKRSLHRIDQEILRKLTQLRPAP